MKDTELERSIIELEMAASREELYGSFTHIKSSKFLGRVDKLKQLREQRIQALVDKCARCMDELS